MPASSGRWRRPGRPCCLFARRHGGEKTLEAVAQIRRRGDQDARGLLASLPGEPSASLRRTVADAIVAIDNRLAAWNVAQNLWYGLSLGSVLLLAAIGLAITFGVMGVINMAHGEMVMLGAYTTFVVQEVIRTRRRGLFDYSLAIAIPSGVPGRRPGGHVPSSVASSASSTAARSRRCSPPGASA